MHGLLLLIALSPFSDLPVSMQVYQSHVLIQRGFFTYFQPIVSKPQPSKSVRYRRDQRYAVWDPRGLTVRDGKWVFSTRLQDVPVSPKLFSKEEIRSNLGRVKNGERSLAASALSGTGRVGSHCYFLPRWLDAEGNPWLEALILIDLDKPQSKPQLLGRFEGLTLAEGRLDDRLFVLGKAPAALVRATKGWGLATYDPVKQDFNFKRVGERLRAHAILDVRSAVYVEALEYGPSRLGTLNLPKGARTDLFEARGTMRLLDGGAPLCAVIGTPDRTIIRNVYEGSQAEQPSGAGVARTPFGILTWWPRGTPTVAALIEPVRMKMVASWAGTPILTEKPKPAVKKAPVKKTTPRKAGRGRAASKRPSATTQRQRRGAKSRVRAARPRSARPSAKSPSRSRR